MLIFLLFRSKQRNVVKVAVNLHPSCSVVNSGNVDNKNAFSGFDIELLNAIAKEEGLTLNFTVVPFENMIKLISSGEYDMGTPISILSSRENHLMFSCPIDETEIVWVQDNSNKHQKVINIGSLCGISSFYANKFKNKNQFLIKYKNYKELSNAMNNGKIQAIVADCYVASAIVKLNEGHHYEISQAIAQEYPGYPVNSNLKSLLNKINNGIKATMKDGTYLKIYRKYHKSCKK